jgi:hypothetical protein
MIPADAVSDLVSFAHPDAQGIIFYLYTRDLDVAPPKE